MIIHESRLPQTSLRGAKRRGNLMNLTNHDEITTLSPIAHEAVVPHRECAVTKQMWRDRLAVREKMPINIKGFFRKSGL